MEKNVIVDSELNRCSGQVGKMRSFSPGIPGEFTQSKETCKGNAKGRVKIEIIVVVEIKL
jgi:hypothetical protein